MKVLIVDDAPTNLKLLRAVLEAEGIEVLEASDGLQALALLGREAVDAVISDILMPRMDGYRLCYEIRRRERWQALPFIFFTATYTSTSDEKLAYLVGGDKYLQKPATGKALLAALEEAARSATRPRPNHGKLSEADVVKEYSERLVSKLEIKNIELFEAKRRLEESNRQLEQSQAELLQANNELESRVQVRTAELNAANERLESFSYSVSHDLRAPLRHITGFAKLLLKNGAPQLDGENAKCLQIIHNSAERMGHLIEAMLELAQVSRARFNQGSVNLTALAEDILLELQKSDPHRHVNLKIASNLCAPGDPRLLRIALANLLSNAWKFTARTAEAHIEFGGAPDSSQPVFFVRDNGAGFDMAHVKRLFTAFQRLHTRDDFEGSGIGLATVKRIVERHGGKIWAEGAVGKGATFAFTLGDGITREAPREFTTKK